MISAAAFAASIGEPPPIPITKSQPASVPVLAALKQVSTEGFSSISLKISNPIPSFSSAVFTSSSEPFFTAE